MNKKYPLVYCKVMVFHIINLNEFGNLSITKVRHQTDLFCHLGKNYIFLCGSKGQLSSCESGILGTYMHFTINPILWTHKCVHEADHVQ